MIPRAKSSRGRSHFPFSPPLRSWLRNEAQEGRGRGSPVVLALPAGPGPGPPGRLSQTLLTPEALSLITQVMAWPTLRGGRNRVSTHAPGALTARLTRCPTSHFLCTSSSLNPFMRNSLRSKPCEIEASLYTRPGLLPAPARVQPLPAQMPGKSRAGIWRESGDLRGSPSNSGGWGVDKEPLRYLRAPAPE